MGFLSGLFSDKKKVESNSNQTGQQSYGLSDEAKNYWSTVAPTFQQGWTPVANDPNQIAAAGAQAGLSSGLNPAFNTATGIGASGISTADIQRFQNPYEDQVVRDTLEDMRYADSQALSQSNAAAAKAGALGGTSGIVRRNLLEDNFQDARNKAVTGIRQAGFNTAADLATKSTQAQLAGVGAASGIAGQQSGINQTQFGMGTQGWNQAWQNANQPFTVAGQGAQVLAGLSPASGQNTSGTSTGTQTTTASPSLFSVGANLLGAGFAGGWRPFAANGGRIEMADGGAVDGDAPQGQKDPHAKFKSAFDAISSMLERARGGSVSGMAPMRAGGGPVGSWSTTVTPASTFDNKAFGQSLSKMGESKGGGGDDAALLQQQQQALSSMLSGMSGRRAAGGGVWDETGPEFGGSSGMAPMRLGAGAEPVQRTELPPARPSASSGDPLLGEIKRFEGYTPKSSWDYKQHSVGYGTRARHPGEVIDRDEAERRLADEVAKARSIVDRFAPNADPGTKAALTSLTYNAGDDWTRAGLGSAIRSGNMDEARRRFVQYNKAGGETLPGLVNRRQAEVAWMGGAGPSGDGGGSAPVRMASVEPTSSSGAPIATDAPKRGGWFNEGVWTGEKMTPMQRLGIGLMSVRGPMFGGPMNDMAKQLMGMEEGRLNEKRIDSQADQFAKQIAQQAAIAAGMVDGKSTVAARQADASIAEADANRRIREASVTGTYDGQPTIAGRTAESNLRTAEMVREAKEIELDRAKNPEKAFERRKELADRYGLTGDQRTQFIFDGKIPDKTAATESTVDKEVSKASVEMAQKGIQSAQGAKESLRSIDELRGLADDPNLEGAIGPLDQYSMAQTVGKYIPFASGQFNPELNAKIQRIQQQLTLAGGEKMKGLGAQSDADAARLERAVSGLTSARDRKEFLDALRVIEDSVIPTYNRGVEAARKFPRLSDEFAKSPLRDRQANEEARAAIKAGADREAVRKRLIERGIDPAGI